MFKLLKQINEKEQLNEERYTDRDALMQISQNIKENKDEDPVTVLNWITSFVQRQLSLKHRMSSPNRDKRNLPETEEGKLKLDLLTSINEGTLSAKSESE